MNEQLIEYTFLCKICYSNVKRIVFRYYLNSSKVIFKYCDTCLVNYVFGKNSIRSMIIEINNTKI